MVTKLKPLLFRVTRAVLNKAVVLNITSIFTAKKRMRFQGTQNQRQLQSLKKHAHLQRKPWWVFRNSLFKLLKVLPLAW